MGPPKATYSNLRRTETMVATMMIPAVFGVAMVALFYYIRRM